MTILKIISGGQTGVDRAALDVAIELGVRHGGWVPKGRKAEDGIISTKYNLQELCSSDYSNRTQKNVLNSDGTLIITRGGIKNGSKLTLKLVMQHGLSYFHLDLNSMDVFFGAKSISSWISRNKIQILNVAGPRASQDEEIYMDSIKIIKMVIYLDLIESNLSQSYHISVCKPQTVAEAITRLIVELPFKEKIKMAKMQAKKLALLDPLLGEYIRNVFGLYGYNQELMESCQTFVKGKSHNFSEYTASEIIIKELWKNLQRSYKLRRIK